MKALTDFGGWLGIEAVTFKEADGADPQGVIERLAQCSLWVVGLVSLATSCAVAAIWSIQDFTGVVLLALSIGIPIAVSLAAAYQYIANRHPSAPRVPKVKRARRSWTGFPPPRTVHLLSDRCTICGRPLTTYASRKARVGSTCIKQYGPRFMKIENPKYRDWERTKARAEAMRALEQQKLDAAHAQRLHEHSDALVLWQRELASANGGLRERNRRVASTAFGRAVFGIATIGTVLVAGAFAAGIT